MDTGTVGVETGPAADPPASVDCSIASLRRQAWAKSKDSVWHQSAPERPGDPQGPQPSQNQGEGDAPKGPEETGRVPNKITSWLSECRTPIGASLDEQTASPTRGALRNGCSFEDDLSLGAEANLLQSSPSKPDPCFGLAADQKRSQFKERARSMNSTGSGKSSTVSSVSELLDLYEEDPEEILLNLGFGREEPDVATRVPSRFLSHTSSARGIDIKVYLGAQLQRLELENPNYALTSRFRQIEVFTSVANEFFQLYSQVSGQPVHRISTRDLGGEEGRGGGGGGGGGEKDEPPPLKKTNSALNVAKRLKKTISKHNLQVGTSGSHDTATPTQQPQVNGHAHSDHAHSNGHAHTSPEQNVCGAASDHPGETGSNKHNRKKDSCVLATVTEETNGDGETDKPPENSPERNGVEPSANETPQTESPDAPSANQTADEEEKTRTSTPDKTPAPLVCPHLAQLRTENADSFDMEEIQSNDDDVLPPRSSKNADLLRTVSQQSDSSGFAEEPSTDFNSFLKAKLQASSDSCDSENTVTSHPSQEVVTPLAVDQPAFVLLNGEEEEEQKEEPGGVAETDGRSRSREEEEHDGNSEQFLQYTAHHLPRNRPVELDPDEDELVQTGDPHPEPEPSQGQSALESEPDQGQSALESEPGQGQSASEPDQGQSASEPDQDKSASEPEPSQVQSASEPDQGQSASESKPSQVQPVSEPEPNQGQSSSELEPEQSEPETQPASDPDPDPDPLSDGPGGDGLVLPPPPPSSPVLRALNRAKQYQLSRGRLQVLPDGDSQGLETGQGRRGLPLQRSSSLPSSLLAPSRVVSSVRIQFSQGQSSCSQPRYSYKYTQEGAGPDEDQDKMEKKEEDEVESGRSLSTLIINSAPSCRTTKPPQLPTEPLTPPKPIPRYLMRSSYSLQSSSPPPDWSQGGHAPSWSTQSVPDLSSNQNHQMSNHTHQAGFTFPAPRYLNQSPNPSPGFVSSPNPFPMNPPPQYPPPLQPHPHPHPYSSLPNLFYTHSPSLNHYPAHHHTTPPIIPQHSSLPHLHPPPTSSAPPHHGSLHNLHPATPIMHHQTSYHASVYASPYHGYHGYNMMTPPLGYTQYPLLSPEHSFHLGLAPPMAPPPVAPGFHPSLSSVFSPSSSLHHGLTSVQNQVPSTTEMQLRRVLHDIRGTVQSLGQSPSGTPDVFSEHRSVPPTHQSLTELQQKRRSLNLFRSQMMDLELSIIRQQALVYKHLSPADRVEVEQLQSLRSAVREELQELEQQLEDRLVDLTKPSEHRGLHRDRSVDSLSTASALRAMEPMSDLLREQLFLQSELSYDCHAPSTSPSSRSSSPVRGGGGEGVYRASINITPAPPPRPNAQTEEEEEEEKERREMGGGGGETEVPEEKGGAGGGARVDNMQQLLKEIRDSVAEEVRREIYGELLAAVTTRPLPVPDRPHPL